MDQYAPLSIWDEAVKQAQRSTHNRHRTGAVICTFGGLIKARGCSHKHNGGLKINSIHAERHALRNYHEWAMPRDCIIVTLTRVGNFANCSRPCVECASALQGRNLRAIYAERTNDGGWAIRDVNNADLLDGYLKPTKYA